MQRTNQLPSQNCPLKPIFWWPIPPFPVCFFFHILLTTEIEFSNQCCVAGYFVWRNSFTGSWFIQELCAVLMADYEGPKHHDIATLLTVVARKVAVLYQSNTGQAGSHGKKQMVSISSTLTRRAFLTG